MTRPAIIRTHIDAFLETGEEVENLRDIWYKFKHKIEYLKPEPTKKKKWTEADWSDYVNEKIGSHLFDLYLKGDTSIYSRLNIITTGLSNLGYLNNTPVVLFSEKRTRALDNATKALLCGRYTSEGQIPSFETVNIAEYLLDTSISGNVYLIGLTDYDPAGENIFKTLVEKVTASLALLDQNITLHSATVSYGNDYMSIINSYDSFTLSTNPKNMLNKPWIEIGHTQGVELNVMPDKKERIEDLIMDFVDPVTMEFISLERAKATALHDLHVNDSEYLRLTDELSNREAELEAQIDDMRVTFNPIWGTSISTKKIENMTTLERRA